MLYTPSSINYVKVNKKKKHVKQIILDNQFLTFIIFRQLSNYQNIKNSFMNKNINNVTKIFKALSDENRIKILLSIYKKECKCIKYELSCRDETCIKDLSKSLKITTPTISHHIKELVNSGLITTKKDGRWVYCEINQKTFQKICSFLNNFSTIESQHNEKTSERNK